MSEPAPKFHDLTADHLAPHVARWGWSIGAHTYGNPRVLEKSLARLVIGRYCMIGPDVKIVLGGHRPEFVTTYPFTALAQFWPAAAGGAPDHRSRGDVTLGHEVWVGADAVILSGVTIGTGAVIGAGAVVRADVPAYGIVAGNPAALVRHRFDPGTIARLIATDWWNWPDAVVSAHLGLLLSADIEAFLRAAEARAAAGDAAAAEPASA